MTMGLTQTRTKKQMSLSPQTIHIQHQVAKWTKQGRKHWDLYRWIMNPYLLYDAVEQVVRNDGSAGIDGMSTKQIKGREWDFAKEIALELKSGTYHPSAVRRVYIPKRNGKKRPLGIPTVRDRVVQRALMLIMEPIYEERFFPNSYGFRRGKSAVECTAIAANEIYNHRLVLEADIKDFFGNVSQKKLLGMLKEEIVDPRILQLILNITRAGAIERNKPWQPTWKGTPQGGPLSPLLANIYLHYALDKRFNKMNLKGTKLLRYCDDFIIVGTGEREIKVAQELLQKWMQEAKLKLKEEKTKVIDMRNAKRSRQSHFNFLGLRFHLRAYKDNNKRFWIARQPSEEARKSLRENLKSKLRPDLIPTLAKNITKSVWMGWCNYFRYGNSNHIIHREIKNVRQIVEWYLRRKFRHQKHPRRWRDMWHLRKWITSEIKPVRVIPNYLDQHQTLMQPERAVYWKSVRTVR